MVAVWTERFSSWVPTVHGSWVNYDLYTNQSVPKGAVAVIAAGWSGNTPSNPIGVRTDGSALERKMYIQNANGGVNYIVYYVVCHSTTGFIETLSDSNYTTFYLLGYWTGTTFTETYHHIESHTDNQWTNCEAYSSFGIPKNRVCVVAFGHHTSSTNFSNTIGIRTYGSNLNRTIEMNGEYNYVGVDLLTAGVKTDSVYGRFQYYNLKGTTAAPWDDIHFFIQGYFDESMDYIETAPSQMYPYMDGVWHEVQVWEDGVSVVYDVYALNENRNTAMKGGARSTTSSLDRYFVEQPAIYNGFAGVIIPTYADETGKVDLYGNVDKYGNPASFSNFGVLGYYVPAVKPFIYVYNGSSWVAQTNVKVWNGAEWSSNYIMKYWNGTEWVNL